jgi:predicted membrane channel-forming protein YqfA (hemolysin III family)
MFRTRNEGEGIMRALGINWLAVLAAAVAIYAIGFVIYGMLIPEETVTSSMTEEQLAMGQSRMAFGVVMPILTAAFMAIIFRWANVASATKGAQLAALVALASAIPTILYGWVYGGMDTGSLAIDSAHLMLGHVVAGAILGGWR